ncbi:MAG TPA: BlaI/MecI/CopY family transcriptional regulator [Niabella sp.]|jgi:BlaI family penicillinase repressor|nr:BlaI/MecI/CopY family transcriptional regulator [Chitinophagaceae bacterium]HRN48330.1 BlaI/MecI/CopY family transcriptional regulator [Niabella sp.]HRO84530.1 BlaI/MecI/CopY family transcriptional regulator [Niabella sp.]HUN04317.1 BlaI/MecI/CopY family transcriptional regulator [Niabella sp.]
MKQLTKAEEQIMQVLWKHGALFLGDIVDAMPIPKPHQNTVATILRILVEKEYVSIQVFGRQHQYAALIAKEAYSKKNIKKMVQNYFDGSFVNVVSFMMKEKNISVEELESLLQQIKKSKK